MILPMFPILLIVTALGSVFLYLRTSHEIYGVLAIGTAIVCLIWGLVVAHWSIHVVTLLLLFKFKSPLLKAVEVVNK